MNKEMNSFILRVIENPDSSLEDEKIKILYTNDIKNILKKRNRDSHKGTYGRVGILSGSKGMAGAAVLNLNAALRSGTGLVKGCITDSIYNVVEAMSIEAITYPFDEQNISFDELYKELILFSDVIATGSGCTNMKNYNKILDFILSCAEKPVIIDAEGINLLNLDKLKYHNQPVILTPHYGEMSRLIKKDINHVRENVINIAEEFAYNYNVHLILKGARTVIAAPNRQVYINTTGNPGMATAGSGDVLTGIIASFIGQKIELIDALKAAVFIHGLAGDMGSECLGEYSLIAGDIIKYLPEAIKSLTD